MSERSGSGKGTAITVVLFMSVAAALAYTWTTQGYTARLNAQREAAALSDWRRAHPEEARRLDETTKKQVRAADEKIRQWFATTLGLDLTRLKDSAPSVAFDKNLTRDKLEISATVKCFDLSNTNEVLRCQAAVKRWAVIKCLNSEGWQFCDSIQDREH